MSKTAEKIDFESAMAELESLITKMEENDLSLEESLKDFEKGISLTRICQSSLKDAEQRVRILTENGEENLSED